MSDLISEMWKDISDYEGIYQVSNLGRVRSLKTFRVLIPGFGGRGYSVVTLCKHGERHSLSVHRLVAIAFIPNLNDYPCINHKDEIRTNNSACNLEWCTYKYNLNYGDYQQRKADKRSMPVVQKTKLGEVVKVYKSRIDAQRETGIHQGSICGCINNKLKSAGGYLWENA